MLNRFNAPAEAVPLSPFEEQFMAKRAIVDAGVAHFADGFRERFAQEDNPHLQATAEGFLSLLTRGGKRWRGVLTVVGNELYGGDDLDVATQASGAIEGLHAFMLTLDDCADQDDIRRGGLAFHAYVARYLEQQGAHGDLVAAGMSIATTAGVIAQYWANEIIEDLPVTRERNTIARRLINRECINTGIGQSLDILGSHLLLDEADIIKAAQYKTARYTFLLPLQVGAALAGAPQEELAAFESYANNVGLAFQLRDDIMGLFGTSDTGKSAHTDIVSNKQTLLMAKTRQLANNAERSVLEAALGNKLLNKDDLQRCLEIIQSTGALAMMETCIDRYTEQALDALAGTPEHWPHEQVGFLRTLALQGAKRRT